MNYNIKTILNAGGLPGYLLTGYWVVQTVFQRGKIDATAIDGSAIIFMLYTFICLGVSWYFLFYNQSDRINFEWRFFLNTPIIWFVLYTLLGFISAIWSLHYQLTIYRSIESLAMFLLMVAAVKGLISKGIPMLIQWTIYYVFFTIIIRFISYLSQGAGFGVSIGYGGVFECAQMIAPVFFFLGVYHAKKWVVRWTFIIFSFLSMATVGYMGMALGLSTLAFGNVRMKTLAVLVGFIVLFLVILVGPYNLLKNTVFIERTDISMEHTSGRDQIWEMGFEWFKERPFTGYGFTAGETFLIRNGEGRLAVIGMHNSIMSALVGVGIFGVVFLTLFFLGMFKITFSSYMPLKYRPALIAIFLSAFVQSMGNPGIGFRVYGSWMAAMYVCVLITGIYVQNKYYYYERLKMLKQVTHSLTKNE